MTPCIACPDRDEHDPDYEEGWLVCRRAHDRMLAALRDIPVLVDELAGLGYVERDAGLRVPDGAVRWPNTRKEDVAVPGRDPVANVLTAGPVGGAGRGPRAGGTRERSLPIRVDPTDLLGPVNHAARALLARGVLGLDVDQVGHLSVATMLDGWARDWAASLGHALPHPSVPSLAGWLLDRLDWACRSHAALDEFAADLREYRGTLTALCGRSEPRPVALDAPCPGCGDLSLYRDVDLECVACWGCAVLLSEEGYAGHVRALVDGARA